MAIENLLILSGIVSILVLSSEFECCALFEDVLRETEDEAVLTCVENLMLITEIIELLCLI